MPGGSTEDFNREPPEITGAETLKAALTAEKEKAEINLIGWQRAQADFTNYKRHVEQETAAGSDLAKAGLILTLLPVLDDLERAFTALPEDITDSGWVDGFRLIERKFRTTLETQGLSSIKALGEPFDPRFHEAAMQSDGEEGIVVGELEKGYQFNGRIIRTSKVVVGNGRTGNRSRVRKRGHQFEI